MQQVRRQLKHLRRAAQAGDLEAVRALLAHSVAVGHSRLGLKRYFLARALGCEGIDGFRDFARKACRCLSPGDLLAIARHSTLDVGVIHNMHFFASEVMKLEKPTLLPYDGIFPTVANTLRLCGKDVTIAGKVKLGSGSMLGHGSTIRADGNHVEIGDGFLLGCSSTVRFGHEGYPTVIAHGVTVGMNALIHACAIGRRSVVEDGVVIPGGSIVGEDVLIEANSTVNSRSILTSGCVFEGNPARPVRNIDPAELETRRTDLIEAAATSMFTRATDRTDLPWKGPFAAPTADLEGGPMTSQPSA